MQSHDDNDAGSPILNAALRGFAEAREKTQDRFDQLRARADKMTEEGTNRITAGAPGESADNATVDGFGTISKLPDDPLCLRISIGELTMQVEPRCYLTFRGDARAVADLLRRAAAALDESYFLANSSSPA